jgi:hypothetical protein
MLDVKNMPHMIEYHQLNPDHTSVKTELRRETRVDSYGNKHEWTLYHKTPGYECAGAAMRLVSRECWGVITRIDGSTCGAWVKTLAEAEWLLGLKGEVVR